MKKSIKLGGLVALLLYLSGCASVSGPSYQEAKAKQNKPGYAMVYIFREYAEPTLWGVTIKVDGKKVAKLKQKGFTWIYVKPGKRNISSVWPGMASQRSSTLALNLSAGETYYLELTGVSRADLVGGEVRGNTVTTILDVDINSQLSLLNPDDAKERLEKCCKFKEPASTSY